MSGSSDDNNQDLTRRKLLQNSLASAGALSALSISPFSLGASADDPVATTRSGKIRGYRDSGINIFKGVAYGADTHRQRFQPPRPPEPWKGVRAATAYGAAAPQRSDDEPISEDCLFINVWTPGLRDKARRPIIC